MYSNPTRTHCDVIIPTAYARFVLRGAEQMRTPNCDVIMQFPNLRAISKEKSGRGRMSVTFLTAPWQLCALFWNCVHKLTDAAIMQIIAASK